MICRAVARWHRRPELQLGRARGLLVAFVLTAVLGAGCVSHRGGNSRFIRSSGGGYIDVGGKAPEPELSKEIEEKLARAHREALAERAAAEPETLPSIEGRDPGLKEALAALMGLGEEPTVAAHIRVALEYQRLGIADAAFDQFSAALRVDPESAAAWDGRARLWRDWGLLRFALSDATRARYFAPRSPAVLNTLGTILQRVGDCESARQVYTTAVTLDPGARYAAINLHRLTEGCGAP